MDRKEYAVELKHKGNNCAQAVLLAFEDIVDLSADDLRKLGAAFGGGMGCMEGTCGALCGAEMILGLKRYEGKPIMSEAGELHRAFAEKCTATICKDLKGRDTGRVLCSCDDCVRHAVEAVSGSLRAVIMTGV